jgi:hypothetical protein
METPMLRLLTTLLTLLTLSQSAEADLLPPGKKSVRCVVKVVGLDPASKHRYVLAPINRFPPIALRPKGKGVNPKDPKTIEHALIVEGKALPFGRYSRPRIYLLEDPNKKLEDLDDAWFLSKSRVVSAPLEQERVVARLDSTERVVISYRIQGKKSRVLELKKSVERFDKAGKPSKAGAPFIWLALISLMAGGALLETGRRRRAKITAELSS